MEMPEERLHQLFLLNICLQVFDGVATYQGLLWQWNEGNPLLLAAMPYLGVGPTLALFKAKACAFLLLLRRLGSRPLVYESLVVLATLYTFLSFIPWLTRIVSLLRL
jgi:hypothetical protein